MVSRLILVLGDQLSTDLSALQAADRDTDIVVMAEVADEATYVQHHPKKIAFLFAAMRKFAARLRDELKRLKSVDRPQVIRAIAEAHGGTASAGNRAEGGAWVRIALPRLRRAPYLP